MKIHSVTAYAVHPDGDIIAENIAEFVFVTVVLYKKTSREATCFCFGLTVAPHDLWLGLSCSERHSELKHYV